MALETLRLRGKEIGEEELRIIREVLRRPPKAKRTPIAREICARLGWNQSNGQPQQTAALEILQGLERRGFLQLPRAQRGPRHLTPPSRESFAELPFAADEAGLLPTDMKSVTLSRVEGRGEVKMFGELMRQHHYLGSPGGVGRSVKYVFRHGASVIGGISWGSASWKVACRDRWIGWDADARMKNLSGIACNLRFLIIPKVKNLASHLLSRAVKHLSMDWPRLYREELILLETFVQKDKFRGTCYQAANWIYVGDTKGRGRGDRCHEWKEPVKGVWMKPLVPDFRERLGGRGEER